MDRVGAVGGTGYVPEDLDPGVTSAGGAGTDPLALELASDRAEVAAVAAPAPRAASPATSAASAMADAFVAGGWEGVDGWVDAHPDEVRALVTTDRASVEGEVRAALGRAYGGGVVGGTRAWWNADGLCDRLADRFTAMAHERVRGEATSVVRAELRELEATSPAALLGTLRAAPPGSATAALAASLHLDGSDMDVERVELHRETALAELGMLRDVLEGGTWTPDELPGTSARVLAALGLGEPAEGSIAAAAFRRDEALDDLPAYTEMGLDASVAAYEISHAVAHGALLVGGAALAVGVGALAFGVALHHAIGDNRAERREAARHVGL